MLETMEKSSGNVIGYKLSGDVTKEDYATLDPAVEAAVERYGTINLLFDITELHWEKVSAWSSDIDFGKKYKGAIEKMALVGKMQGNKAWQKAADEAMEPFYAKTIQYFESDNDAWDWLNS